MTKPKQYIVSARYRNDARELVERRARVEAVSAAAAKEIHAASVLAQDGFPVLRITADLVRAA